MSVNIVHSDGSLEKIAGMGFGGGVPSGGTAGQVLAKKSNTDYDTEWADDGGIPTDEIIRYINNINEASKPLKPVVFFSFDSPNEDARATILEANGFRGVYAFRNDSNFTSGMKNLIASGHDYSIYSGDITKTKPANTASVEEWIDYIKPVIDYFTENGIHYPTFYSCSQQFCTANQMEAAKRLGIKYVRASTVDPNNTGSSSGYIYPKIKDFNPFATYIKANAISQGVATIKGLIDDAIEHNYTLCLFSHTFNMDGYTEAEFVEIVEYVKAKQDAGLLECLTPRQYYDKYRHESDFRKDLLDVENKADRVSDATSGNFAGLDANGNLTDSGKSALDFLTTETYDSTSDVANAGGISPFVNNKINTYEKLYDIMPSASKISTMADYTCFRTKGYYSVGDGAAGRYVVRTGDSSNPPKNALVVTSGNNTRYLTILSEDGERANHIELIKFGIRPTRASLDDRESALDPSAIYATANSAIMSNLTPLRSGTVLEFGYGTFAFAAPLSFDGFITLKGKMTPMSLKAANSDNCNGSKLAFPFLTNGQAAITMHMGNIEDLMIYGSYGTYFIDFDRTKTVSAPNEVVTETIATDNGTEIKCTGISNNNVKGGGHYRNVSVVGFYTGIDFATGNKYLEDIYCERCHLGLVIDHDIKCVGVYGKQVHTLATIKGSVCSIEQLRVDSCVHAVNVQTGWCITLNDIDGDYCTDSLIDLGNDSNYGELYDLSITNAHGRCNTLKAYPVATYPNGLDLRDLPSGTVPNDYGIIRLRSNTKIYRCYFQINGNTPRNPFDDGIMTYACPNIAFVYGDTARVNDCILSFPTQDVSTSDDIKKIIYTTLVHPNTMRVDVSSGTYYINRQTVTREISINELQTVVAASSDFADFQTRIAAL